MPGGDGPMVDCLSFELNLLSVSYQYPNIFISISRYQNATILTILLFITINSDSGFLNVVELMLS